MIDCSIIIVSYNTEALTLQCLDSIFRYSYEPYTIEVIVVDNASKDNSVQLIQEKFPQCTLIVNKENTGFARANNQAIIRSTGRTVLLLNSDTIVLENSIKCTIDYLLTHKQAGMVGCRLYYPGMKHQPSISRLPTLYHMFNEYLRSRITNCYPEDAYKSTQSVECIIGAFMLVSREALSNVGLLDERYFMNSEDVDWCKRFREKGYQIHYIADTAIIHIAGGSISRHPLWMKLELHKNRVKYFYFNHSLFHAIVAFLILAIWLPKQIIVSSIKKMVKQ